MESVSNFEDLPRLGIGTHAFSGSAADLREAVADRPRLIDTSPLYGTEAVVGEAARGMRGRFFIATKVFPDAFRRQELRRSVHESLGQLQTDYLDMLQLHWPSDEVPAAETIGAMSELIDEGLLRYIGVCNFRVNELEAVVAAAGRHPVVSNQVAYSLFDRRFETDVKPYCHGHGVTFMAYSPLAGGGPELLEGRDKHHALQRIARERGVSASQVALAWTLREPGTMAIPRSSSIDHIRDNWRAEELHLTLAEIEELSSSVTPRRRRGETEENLRLALRRRLYSPSGELTAAGRFVHAARDSARNLGRRARRH